jgi:hypothetical protein
MRFIQRGIIAAMAPLTSSNSWFDALSDCFGYHLHRQGGTHPRSRLATNLRGKSQQEEKHEKQRFNFRKLLGCRRVGVVASSG